MKPVTEIGASMIPESMKAARRWICWGSSDRGTLGGTTKVPYQPFLTMSGRVTYASSTDESTWTTYEDAVGFAKSNPEYGLGIGFVLGDGWCGIDLDHVAPDGETIEGQAVEIMEIVGNAGYQEWSPGGDGVHIILECDKPEGLTSRRSLDVGMAEFYGSGRYFTVTGKSFSKDTTKPELNHLDVAIEIGQGFFKPGRVKSTPQPQPSAKKPKRVGGYVVDPLSSQAEAYANAIIAAGDVVSGERNNRMFAIAGHLHKKTQSPDEVLRLCLEINHSCFSPPLEYEELKRCVVNGMTNGTPREDTPADFDVECYGTTSEEDNEEFISKFIARSKRIQREKAPVAACEAFPGFIGEYLRVYREQATEYLPELRISCALNAMSTLVGGRLESAGTVPSIYTVGLAPSGAGKDWPRKLNEKLLRVSGHEERIGPEHISSGEGMTTWLSARNVSLFQLDEAGEMLSETGNHKNANAQRIGKNIKIAYSKAGEEWSPNSKAEAKSNIRIAYTYPVIYFTTTPDRFWESFSLESVEDGLLGRLLIFEQQNYVLGDETKDYMSPRPSQRLIEMAEAWDGASAGGDLPALLVSENRLEWTTSDAGLAARREFFREIDKNAACNSEKDKGHHPLWKRAKDKVLKVALLLAASRQGPVKDGVIEEIDVRLAIDLVKSLTYRVLRRVEENLSSSDHDRTMNKIMKALSREGGQFPEGLISRKVRGTDKRSRDAALLDLLTSGTVVRKLSEDGVRLLSLA